MTHQTHVRVGVVTLVTTVVATVGVFFLQRDLRACLVALTCIPAAVAVVCMMAEIAQKKRPIIQAH